MSFHTQLELNKSTRAIKSYLSVKLAIPGGGDPLKNHLKKHKKDHRLTSLEGVTSGNINFPTSSDPGADMKELVINALASIPSFK